MLKAMMTENPPVLSIKSLINASLIAVVLAILILFTAVLPAEYGIDPTGLGKKMGLIALSEIAPKNTLNCPETKPSAADAKDEASAVATPISELQPLDESKPIQWADTVKIVIPPLKGLEYKFAMGKGAILEFSWITEGEAIYFDFHGEPKGATDGYFKSYKQTKQRELKGVLTAPFEGIHGWYWENETDRPVTINLSTKGSYVIMGVMK
jgi:hypothetical protein